MADAQLQFLGYSNIYLQGDDALFFSSSFPNGIEYRVASPVSHILIRDFRSAPAEIVRLLIGKQDNGEFALVFNQPALIKISKTDSQVQIEITEGWSSGELPTLWLGVIDDGTMSAFEIEWEVYEQVGETRIAFAALIRENSQTKYSLEDLPSVSLVADES